MCRGPSFGPFACGANFKGPFGCRLHMIRPQVCIKKKLLSKLRRVIFYFISKARNAGLVGDGGQKFRA